MLELLIVEDDEMLRESLAMLFRREGFAVTTAGNGEEALKLAFQQTFDIMISDIRMAGLDGVETVRRVREAQPATHFVLITGYASDDAPVQALRLKVDDYFRKPFDLPVFVERIRAIGRSRLRTGPDAAQGVRRFAGILREAWSAWGEHADRVTALCDAVGRRLGLAATEAAALHLAALYHDLRNGEAGLLPHTTGDVEPSGTLEHAAAILAGHAGLAGQVLSGVLGYLSSGWDGVGEPQVREALGSCLEGQDGVVAAPPPDDARPALVLRTLGALDILAEGQPVSRSDWESGSARNLFLLLLCDRGRRVSEDRIIEALWPDADADKAKRALRTAVYRVRKALRSADVIQTGERYYRFNPDVSHSWDYQQLEDSAARATALESAHDAAGALKAWKQAVALSRGVFLEGVEAEWADPLRGKGQDLALRSRLRAAALAASAGDVEAALQYGRSALDLDRTCEEAQTFMVHTLGAAGRRDEAVKAYHAAVEVLHRDLGLGPGPALMRAYLVLTQGSVR